MPSYDYTRLERVLWDVPAAEALPAEIARSGRSRAFIIASRTLSRETPFVEGLRRALGECCVGLFDEIPAHVPRETVLRAAEALRVTRADVIVTVGGGSVVDGAKMAQVACSYGLRAVEEMEGLGARLHAHVGEPLAPRQIAIPTTLSGAEFGWGAGSTDTRGQPIKHVVRHPDLMPLSVILDPAMTLRTPQRLWLSTGMRAVDHAVETLCSVQANPFTDATARQALALLARGLRASHADPADLSARRDCQLGAWMSMSAVPGGIALGASHAIGHVLGGAFNVPHGFTSCVMLPAVLRHHAAASEAGQRAVVEAMAGDRGTAAETIGALVRALGLPTSLAEVGVRETQFPVVARQTLMERWAGTNPLPLRTEDDVIEVLRLAA